MSQVLQGPSCWCGNEELEVFSSDYFKCTKCETLISRHFQAGNISQVGPDEQGLYGRDYWFSHQEEQLGSPNIISRSRSDLAERCSYWLKHLLKYQLPPGQALEIGCGHGAFVALMNWAGFKATGLELSPWVVEYARETFEINVLEGPVEAQTFAQNSFELIILMDVLEHLTDPVATIRHCLELLKPDGQLIIQTPRYPEGKTYQELLDQNDLFLKMLIPDEHYYLFSQTGIEQFFAKPEVSAGSTAQLAFEPALAPHDMFLVASRAPLRVNSPEQISGYLANPPLKRLVQALLDKEQTQQNLLNDFHLVSDSLANKEQSLKAAHLQLVQEEKIKQEILRPMTQALNHKDTELIRLTEELNRKEAELIRLNEWINQTNQTAQQALDSMTEEVSRKNAELIRLNEWIDQKNQTAQQALDSLTSHLAQKEAELRRLYENIQPAT